MSMADSLRESLTKSVENIIQNHFTNEYIDNLSKYLNKNIENLDEKVLKKHIRDFLTKQKVYVEPEKEKNLDDVKIDLVEYSEKSYAVLGDTKILKDALKKLGGKYNSRLACGPGWIFPKTKYNSIKKTLEHVKVDFKEYTRKEYTKLKEKGGQKDGNRSRGKADSGRKKKSKSNNYDEEPDGVVFLPNKRRLKRV